MEKNILLTGATDGIGLETAKIIVQNGHNLLLHGRNEAKAQIVKDELLTINPNASIDLYIADLANLTQVKSMAEAIIASEKKLDAIINNAGIFKVKNGLSRYGLDIRFIVNTIAPYLLTRLLIPTLQENARIINLSSAAQMPINWDAFLRGGELDADEAYAQSKLAITSWSAALAKELDKNTVVVAVNPKSFLGSKMVKEAYGREGYDVRIGADILYRAVVSSEFANANGKYFDNDIGSFTNPNPYALHEASMLKLILSMDIFLKREGVL